MPLSPLLQLSYAKSALKALNIPFDLLGDVLHAIRFKKVEKNTVLFDYDEQTKDLIFILKGCVAIYKSVRGKDKCIDFKVEYQFFSSIGFLTKKPNVNKAKAIENCILMYLDQDQYNNLTKKIPYLMKLRCEYLEKEIIQLVEKFHYTHYTEDSYEKYSNFFEVYPQFLLRFPQSEIADYLNMTPVHLSRVKKNYFKKHNQANKK